MQKYNKLVRDKIPEYIRTKGVEPVFHVADEVEYWQKLKEKLKEEVEEFLEAESIEEMADLMEVIDAIHAYKKFNEAEFARIKDQKAADRGRFNDRIILEQS